MDDSSTLDYIEFHISSSSNSSNVSSSSSSSNTCDLFISSRGVTEKVASGHLNTFLAHVRAARERYAENSHMTDIRLHGPLARKEPQRPWFTKMTVHRFVLFVSSPEVLERMKIIEDELIQLEQVRNIQGNSLLQSEDPLLVADLTSNDDVMIVAPFERNQYNPISNDVEQSKRQLLRAMDIRIHALQQEQNMAISRAVKAGFESLIVEDLMSFAEFFGADRLCAACIWFLELLRKTQGVDVKSMEAVKLTTIFQSNQLWNANEGEEASRRPIAQPSSDDLSATSSVKLGSMSKGLPQRASPRRRSMSPLKKIQVGRFGNRRSSSVVMRSINYFSPHEGAKDTNSSMEFSSNDSDECEMNCHDEESEPTRASLLPARRLSVQAAISLFEGKRKDPSESLTRQRSLRQETCRDSSDSFVMLNDEHNCHEKRSALENVIAQSITSDQNISLKGFDSQEINQEFVVPHDLMENILKRRSHSKNLLRSADIDSTGAGAGSEMWSKFSNSGHVSHDLSCSMSNISLESQKSAPPTFPVITERSLSTDEEGPRNYLNEEGNTDSKGCANVKGESMRSSGIMPLSDFNVEALASMIDHPIPNELLYHRYEGRFYEYYQKLRDAKMMEEQQSKRDEREAKIRLMEEILDLRKSEMNARTAKLAKEGKNPRIRAAKLLALQENLCSIPNPEEDVSKEHSKQSGLALQVRDYVLGNSPPSPPLTPPAANEQSIIPRLYKVKKTALTSQNSVITPRSYTQTSSVSPRPAPRGAIDRTLAYLPSGSSISNNPLSCSVPCFSDLKKENTKLTSGKSSGSDHVHPKNGNISKGANKPSTLESSDSIPIPNSCNNRSARRNRSMAHMRRSAVTSGPKILPADKEELSLSLNEQEETKPETSLPSKVRRNAVAPIQEVKPFLRKGSGIGPGAGAGVMKLKSVSMTEATAKSSDEDGPSTPMKDSNEDVPINRRIISDKDDSDDIANDEVTPQNLAMCLVDETGETEIAVDVDTVLNADTDIVHHSDDGSCSVPMLYEEEKLVDTSPVKEEAFLENERAGHKISFPIGVRTHERLKSNNVLNAEASYIQKDIIAQESCGEMILNEADCSTIPISKSDTDLCLHEGEANNNVLLKHLSDSKPQLLQREISATGSTSFHANLIYDEHMLSKQTSLMDASSVKYPTSGTIMVESPVASSVSWNSLQMQYACESDSVRTHKKWGSTLQKPVVVVVPPKEPAKGLKRLLNFARKGRASPEIILADCLSASTTSEGDDDFEDRKAWNHSANDILKSKMQDRRLKEFSDHSSSQEQVSVQSLLRSSIPIPPSNFKLRDDHVSGSTRLKAPRSFFSLSTFRSRSSEGKSR